MTTPLPVLALGASEAEWLPASPTESGASATFDARRPAELADAARAAFEIATLRAGRTPARRAPACILALGPELVRERLFELPPLPKRDRPDVLRRKAASLARCAVDEVLFSASLQTRPASARGEQELDRWLIVAVRRTEVEELLAALRERGIVAKRTVSARLAPAREALARRTSRASGRGLVVVAVEPRATTVSLVAGTALVSESVLAGNLSARRFSTQPGLARALLQEIRSLDAFQRKTDGAGGVSEIAWVGLADEESEPLGAALRTALPGAEVHALGTAHDRIGADAGAVDGLSPVRARMLATCRRRDGFVLDLPLATPLGSKARTGWFAGVVAACALAGALLHGQLAGSLEELERGLPRLRSRQELARRTFARSERARAEIDELRARILRVDAATRADLPLAELVEDALTAFGEDGALASLAVGTDAGRAPAGDAAEVVLAGWTDPDPRVGARRVATIAAALEAGASVADVRVEPPRELPGTDKSGRPVPLPFVLRARTSSGASAGSEERP